MPTLQIKAIYCGKSNCSSCPHHFYIYAYWKEGKRTKCKYVGKLGNKTTDEKIKDMGEWEQWKKVFREHKKTWGEKSFYGNEKKTDNTNRNKKDYSNYNYEEYRQKPGNTHERKKQEQQEDAAIREIENLVNQYRLKFNQKDQDKVQKLLNLIKNKAVQPGEKIAAINAVKRIVKRYIN